jgi:hypothetical protein
VHCSSSSQPDGMCTPGRMLDSVRVPATSLRLQQRLSFGPAHPWYAMCPGLTLALPVLCVPPRLQHHPQHPRVPCAPRDSAGAAHGGQLPGHLIRCPGINDGWHPRPAGALLIVLLNMYSSDKNMEGTNKQGGSGMRRLCFVDRCRAGP